MKHKKLLIEVIGWYGAFIILLGYVLISFNYIPATSLAYQLMTATGAIAIIIVSMDRKAYQSIALNFVWLLIAAVAITKIYI